MPETLQEDQAATAAGIQIVDEKGVIVYSDAGCHKLFGYGQGELIGRDVREIAPGTPSEKRQFIAELMSEIERRGRWNGVIVNQRKDGSSIRTFASIERAIIDGKAYLIGFRTLSDSPES